MMSNKSTPQADSPARELTGRTVLICFLAFFGVVFTVNGVMIRAATSTFGGVETTSAYKAGLTFKNEVAAARAQDALHWTVTGHVERDAAGRVTLDVKVADSRGARPSGISGTVRLAHPANASLDQVIALVPSTDGMLRGETTAAAGQWDVVFDLMRQDERLFRSKSRVVLR